MPSTAATPTTTAGLILLCLHGLLAIWVGIEGFASREGHIQPLGFISGFQCGTAPCDEEEGN
jgi:hypothetical protein